MLSTEMSYEEIFHRLLSIRSGIPVFDFISNALDGEKRKRLEKEYEVFESGNFFVCDTSEPDTRTIEQAVSKTQPDVFILDYIQHATDGGNGDYHAISRLMRFLKDVAVRNNLAVLLVSQLSRAAEIGYDSKGRLLENSRPLLRHLKGSGGLEEESHVVILLSHLVRDDQSPTLPVIADLAKNKNGPKGIVELSFDRVHCRFIGEASEK
jgi:replicative DNA helicase